MEYQCAGNMGIASTAEPHAQTMMQPSSHILRTKVFFFLNVSNQKYKSIGGNIIVVMWLMIAPGKEMSHDTCIEIKVFTHEGNTVVTDFRSTSRSAGVVFKRL